MRPERDNANAYDIVIAARHVGRFIGGHDETTFLSDLTRQDATIYALGQMRTAGVRLSAGYRELFPKVPWRVLDELDAALGESYRDEDLGGLWLVASGGVPSLLTALEPLISAEEPA